ncbi:hypothetical protein WI36_23110 [Burkholderia ubonensis]|nr:hypothetical protein WI36_23110 [Burkholderia ubonensis]
MWLIADMCGRAADQRAAAFGTVAMQRNTRPTDRESRMGLNDLVHAVRTPIGILFRAIHQIVQPGDMLTIDRMTFRACNNSPAVRGRVTDHDNLQCHFGTSFATVTRQIATACAFAHAVDQSPSCSDSFSG